MKARVFAQDSKGILHKKMRASHQDGEGIPLGKARVKMHKKQGYHA